MAFLNDSILDNGLGVLTADGNELHICSAEPTDYSEATATYSLGSDSITIGSPQNASPDGREVVVPAIASASVTGTGTATHYAIVDTIGSTLLATTTLNASQAVTAGQSFTLTSFSIRIPDSV